MTLTARETVYSIFGAYRLAMLDKTGLSYLDRSPEGAIRSFHAALIVLPAYAVLVVLRLWDVLPEVSLLRFITVEGLAYVYKLDRFPAGDVPHLRPARPLGTLFRLPQRL